MNSVNLARRPFVNRRPVIRLALLLWISGAIFALVNVRLYTGHWTGTAENRERLVEADREIRERRSEIGELDRALARINLPQENRQTDFLNALIAYRTFPWSALFDDLEEVLPRDVRLLSVQPAVNLVAEPKKASKPRRSRSRGRRSSAPPPPEPRQEPKALRRDEVNLNLSGVAKTEDALMELIDILYASPSFHWPDLPREDIDPLQRSSSFSVSVVYLTRPVSQQLEEGEEPGGDTPAEGALTEGAKGALAEGAPVEGTATEEARETAVADTAEDESDAEETDDSSDSGADESPRTVRSEAGAAASDPASPRAQAQAPAREPESVERESLDGRGTAGQVPVGKPPAGKPPAGQPSVGQPAVRQQTPPRPRRPVAAVQPGPTSRPPDKPADPAPPGQDGFVEPSASDTPKLRSGAVRPVGLPPPGTGWPVVPPGGLAGVAA